MLRIENRCCNCAVPGYPCIGSLCPLRHAEVYYCDKCGAEIDDDDKHEIGKQEYCQECFDEILGVEE